MEDLSLGSGGFVPVQGGGRVGRPACQPWEATDGAAAGLGSGCMGIAVWGLVGGAVGFTVGLVGGAAGVLGSGSTGVAAWGLLSGFFLCLVLFGASSVVGGVAASVLGAWAPSPGDCLLGFRLVSSFVAGVLGASSKVRVFHESFLAGHV